MTITVRHPTTPKSLPRIFTLQMGVLGTFGLMMVGTGGCLVWTPPLLPLALPMLLIGLVLWIADLRRRVAKMAG